MTAKNLQKAIEKELKYFFQRFKKGDRVKFRIFANQGTVVSARVPGTLLIQFDDKDRPTLHNKTYIEKI